MFSAYVRAAINAGIAVLLAAILTFILGFFLPYLGPEDGLMYATFDALAEWVLFVMLLAIGFTLIARSVVEGGVRR